MNEDLKNITEEQLFLFVHFPQELKEDIRLLISKNIEKFSKELDYLKAFDFSVVDGAEAGPLPYITILDNTTPPPVIKSDEYRLSAKTRENPQPVKVQTFSHNDNKFLIKIMEKDGISTLYFYSKENIEGKKINLSLLPEGKHLVLLKADEPVIIETVEAIQKISVSLA